MFRSRCRKICDCKNRPRALQLVRIFLVRIRHKRMRKKCVENVAKFTNKNYFQKILTHFWFFPFSIFDSSQKSKCFNFFNFLFQETTFNIFHTPADSVSRKSSPTLPTHTQTYAAFRSSPSSFDTLLSFEAQNLVQPHRYQRHWSRLGTRNRCTVLKKYIPAMSRQLKSTFLEANSEMKHYRIKAIILSSKFNR